MKNKKHQSPLRFIAIFIVLFLAFYYFNISYLSLTSHGNHYNAFFAIHLDYISGLRWILIKCTVNLLALFGYTAIYNTDEVLVAGRGVIQIAYTCLGLGVVSFFAAFVIAYPKPVKNKVFFLVAGILGIQILNVFRFALLALYWNRQKNQVIDHHTIFNIFIYLAIAFSLYFWIKTDSIEADAAN